MRVHIDGLYDPRAYCERLQQEFGPLYVLVEKILAPSAPRRDAVRTSPRFWRLRRGGCEGGLILGFGLWRGLMLDRLPVLRQPALDPGHQLDRVGRPLLRRHLVEP